MGTKLVECFDWKAENQPGELLKVADKLAEAGINLDTLWAYTSHENEPKIAAIGKKPARLKAALEKQGIHANATPCFCVTGTDKTGALVKMLRTLADANINIDCLDAMAVGGRYFTAFWVSVADLAKAKKILKVK